MKSFAKLGLAALCGLAVPFSAMAATPPSPQQLATMATRTRQGVFLLQNFSFAPVGAMLKGAKFDPALVQKEAKRLQVLSLMIPEVFKFDTRKFSVKTYAKPIIWTNYSDFVQKAQDLHDAAVKMEAAAKTGNRGQTLRAAGMVGKACGSCHDEFRNKL